MANLDGSYDVTIKSPMGDQKAVLTVNRQSDGFTGEMAGGLGTMPIENGKVSGDTLLWSMDMKVPMPMTLDCQATVDGDNVNGTVKAGAFGDMPLSGTRKS